ncbi:MAG: SMI1/KNR4 family protein [Alphaproteobacteria bacterium]|nr:SMI1/KNR4 family protein [Alphaproteobacteria bacterium]
MANFESGALWHDCVCSRENYVEPAPGARLIASIEQELGGFRLPAAYVELARSQNGGMLRRNFCPMPEPTSWAPDHVVVTGLFAIGRTARYSLCGARGSKFREEEWQYPQIGVYIADTPSAGHQMIALDYRCCGRQGEPAVVYVDEEEDFRVSLIAPDFASFICGLAQDRQYDSDLRLWEDMVALEDAACRLSLPGRGLSCRVQARAPVA